MRSVFPIAAARKRVCGFAATTLTRLRINAFCRLRACRIARASVGGAAALRRYRERTGIAAKLAVVALTSTGFTIADPADAGMLDVVGFDSAAPALIGDFVADRL